MAGVGHCNAYGTMGCTSPLFYVHILPKVGPLRGSSRGRFLSLKSVQQLAGLHLTRVAYYRLDVMVTSPAQVALSVDNTK